MSVYKPGCTPEACLADFALLCSRELAEGGKDGTSLRQGVHAVVLIAECQIEIGSEPT